MIKKIILGIIIVIILFIGGFIIYIQINWDKKYDIAYPDLKISTDSSVIAWGKYLVRGPAHCSNCHVSSYQELILSDQGKDIPLKGGVKFPLGPLGIISPANLTPDTETGIGRYTDGQIFRMMRYGVKPDGTTTLTLMMPFWNMADDDIVAVVSYLRSMKPVKNKVRNPEWTFMGKTVRVLAPLFKPVKNSNPPAKAPPMKPTKERGEYIARYVANCVGCHTKRDPMTFEAIGPEYAGGGEFEPFPELYKVLGVDTTVWVRSPNITPDPGSKLSQFKTVKEWIYRFRQGRLISFSPMHWGPFSRMSDEDLEALWVYLHSIPPVKNDPGPAIFKKE